MVRNWWHVECMGLRELILLCSFRYICWLSSLIRFLRVWLILKVIIAIYKETFLYFIGPLNLMFDRFYFMTLLFQEGDDMVFDHVNCEGVLKNKVKSSLLCLLAHIIIDQSRVCNHQWLGVHAFNNIINRFWAQISFFVPPQKLLRFHWPEQNGVTVKVNNFFAGFKAIHNGHV